MVVQAKFQSTYGLALYENCIRYQNIEKTPWFDIAKFRKLMGVEEGKYKVFRDFKNRVIDKAIEEVNKYASISVTPQYRKQGRKVISIQFSIKSVKEVMITEMGHPIQQASLSEVLKLTFGLSKKQVEEVMSTYDRDYILEKITIIETSPNFTNGKINNLAKYLICALKDDYQPTKSGRNRLQIVREDKAEKEKQKKLEQNRVEAYRRYQNKEMIKLFSRQSKVKQRAFLTQFEENLGKSIYRDIYIRDGINNILIQDQLCLYIRLNNPAILKAIASYEEFCVANTEMFT
jgi:plasmid replication initiation protein